VSVHGDTFIPLFDLQIEQDDVEAVADTLRSGWLTMGPRIAQLEEAFAEHLGCEHAVAVSSCTAALHLAYLAAGIGAGDEVIVPSYTFAATAAAVLYCGGTPVFADVRGEHDLSIDPDHVASLITPRTKAVACVHFAGYAAPVGELRELCDAHDLALVEDVAHAPSATPVGSSRKLGTWGAAGCFSFFSNKVLPSGEGGLLATGDEAIAARARSLRSHAMTSVTWERHRGHAESYDIVDVGFNYRLDEPRAALLLSRLPRLEEEIEARRRLTRRYRELLAGVPGVVVPYSGEEVATSSCYVMPVLVDAERRDDVRIALRERHGVQTSLFYPPVHRFTAYRERFPGVRLPRTEAIAAREITIPLFAHMTDDQQDRVVAALSAELADV
jgi:dTDP-4-amino-4,6-dideoxygalactose transaminase